MKKLKKLGSVLLALAVMFVMTSTAFADATKYSLTITDTKEGHTYEVYQIFTGDISGTAPNYVLSNVKYGQNYDGKQVGTKVPTSELKDITDADNFAQNVRITGTPIATKSSSDGNTIISGLSAGYYLVKDSEADGNKIPSGDAATRYILQVVGDTTVKVKSDVPAVIKKVKENNKTVGGIGNDPNMPGYTLGNGYSDVADYNIGDDVEFLLVGSMPDNIAEYKTYKYYFHDTLSAGLTYNNNAVVTLKTGNNETNVTGSFNITCTNGSLEIKCEDVKKLSGISEESYIVVTYSAKLNSEAEIGLNGNTNKVKLEFSNNPNTGGEGSIGITPDDQVVVFTYELDVTKVANGDNNSEIKLEGAEFKLKNSAGKWATVNDNKITGWVANEDDGTTLTSNSDGIFKVIGLDAGTYNLVETKAPAGYNLLEKPVVIEIIATTSNTQSWNGTPSDALTKLEIKVGDTTNEGDTTSGIVTTTVVNNAGTVLPSTGGIGTTLFYVIGGVLVLAAIVLLVTRRRMREE